MDKKENFDNLDDLLLEPKKDDRLKKILLGSAILLIVLILIILVTKSFVEGESKSKAPVILPPEPAAKPAKPVKKEPLFEEVPIQEEKSAQTTAASSANNASPKPASVGAKPTTQQAKRAETTPKPQPVQPVVKKPQPKPKPATQTRSVSKAKPAPKPHAAKGRYYIQVGAFFRKEPSRKFLDSIRRAGFRYTTLEGTKNGVHFKKLLVGPYPSRSAALKDLAIIKRRINQNAYIFRK